VKVTVSAPKPDIRLTVVELMDLREKEEEKKAVCFCVKVSYGKIKTKKYFSEVFRTKEEAQKYLKDKKDDLMIMAIKNDPRRIVE
jgi:hypothetical protein